MRIAVNTRFLLTNKLEGVGWFTYEVARRLVQANPEHEFIFLFDRPHDPAFIFGDNVTPVVLFPQARHPVLWLWWFEWSVARALKKYQADVFLSPDGYCSLIAKTPTVLVTHDIAFVHLPMHIPAKFRLYYRYFIPRYLRRAERIVTVSNFSKKDIIQQYQISAAKIDVSCNGVRDEFKPLPAEEIQRIRDAYAEGKAYFFYVGSVHPRKNVHGLIEAFDRFKAQTQAPIKLLIAGRFAWQTGAVKNAYDASIHQQDIVFLDYVSDEALPKLMAAALALTYISFFEGFGIPLLEAMHCDVPVLTSNVSSLPEVAGEAGLLVDPHQMDEIAEAMQQLYQNPTLRNDLIQKGRRQREKFSWAQASDIVWRSLQKVIDK